jgi:hypothetical protein
VIGWHGCKNSQNSKTAKVQTTVNNNPDSAWIKRDKTVTELVKSQINVPLQKQFIGRYTHHRTLSVTRTGCGQFTSDDYNYICKNVLRIYAKRRNAAITHGTIEQVKYLTYNSVSFYVDGR